MVLSDYMPPNSDHLPMIGNLLIFVLEIRKYAY